MQDLYLLIKPRFLGFRNRMARSDRSTKKRAFVMGGLGLVFCLGLFVVSCRVLIHFQSAEVIGTFWPGISFP